MGDKLNITNLTFILLCSTIGAAVFTLPSAVFYITESKWLSLLVWVIAGMIALLFGLCYSELGSCYPYEGGDAVYLDKAYGKIVSTCFSLVSLFAILPMGCAFMVKTICLAFECTKSQSKILIGIILFCVGIINYFGNHIVYRTQYVLTMLKIVAIFIFVFLAHFVFFGLIDYIKPETKPILANVGNQFKMNEIIEKMGNIFNAITISLWAYDGFNTGNFIAHNIDRPSKTLVWSTTISTSIIIVIYTFINISFFYVIPTEFLVEQNLIRNYFKYITMNKMCKKILECGLYSLPPLGTLNGSFLVSVSILDSYIKTFNHRKLIRALCIIIYGMIIYSYTLIEKLEIISKNIGFFTYIFYGLSAFSIFIIRRKRDIKPGFRTPLVIVCFCFIFCMALVCFHVYKTIMNAIKYFF